MILFLSKPAGSFLAGFLGCAAAAFCGGTAQAQTPVSFAGSTGNSSTQAAAYGISPSAGTQQFLLTTIDPTGSLPVDGSLGATPANTNVTAFNSFFGLPAGTLSGLGAQDGSGYLSQTLTLSAGAVIRFDFIFPTNEDNTLPVNPPPAEFHNDLAFFTVNGAFNRTIYSASTLSAAQLVLNE